MLYTPNPNAKSDYQRRARIYQHAHATGQRFAGVSEISKSSGVAVGTVRDVMEYAANIGIFERQEAAPGAAYKKAYYRANLPEVERLLHAQGVFSTGHNDSILPVLEFVTYMGGNLFDLWADAFNGNLPYKRIIFAGANRPQLLSYAKKRARKTASILPGEFGFLQPLATKQRDFIISLIK